MKVIKGLEGVATAATVSSCFNCLLEEELLPLVDVEAEEEEMRADEFFLLPLFLSLSLLAVRGAESVPSAAAATATPICPCSSAGSAAFELMFVSCPPPVAVAVVVVVVGLDAF